MTTSPRSNESCVVKFVLKVLLIAFFKNEESIHCEFIPNRQTVNSGFYIVILKCLTSLIRLKKARKMGKVLVIAPRHIYYISKMFSAIANWRMSILKDDN